MYEKTNHQENNDKCIGLDVLRGVGITGIVLYHLFPSVFRGGFLGVPLFFVLSGYLMFITSEAAWKKGIFRVRAYYKKRIHKIIPPLFVMVVMTCCYMTLTNSQYLIGIREEICSIFLGYDNWWQIGQNTSYFSKLAGGSPFTHLWFLAVEIQFYLLWPALFVLYQKICRLLGGKRACFVFLFLALLSAARMLYLYVPESDPSRVYYGTDTMAFPLLIGCFLGAWRQENPAFCQALGRRASLILTCLFLCILSVLILSVDGQNVYLYQGGMFIVSLFFAGAIHFVENQRHDRKFLSHTPLLTLLGKKSYGIYLWHYPVIISLYALWV